ncbi:hypothetical protein [[Scytonema hofmanni] UTEX B 1581]|nr:hypothetical protein [[Scytonema hofmanni] UTEX B 1581]
MPYAPCPMPKLMTLARQQIKLWIICSDCCYQQHLHTFHKHF